MKQLETSFTKNGYNHLIVWRDEDYAITKLTNPGSENFVCYEAFKIDKRTEKVIGDKIIEPRETTPNNEKWGVTGYTVRTLEEAHNKINKIKTRKNGTR